MKDKITVRCFKTNLSVVDKEQGTWILIVHPTYALVPETQTKWHREPIKDLSLYLKEHVIPYVKTNKDKDAVDYFCKKHGVKL